MKERKSSKLSPSHGRFCPNFVLTHMDQGKKKT